MFNKIKKYAKENYLKHRLEQIDELFTFTVVGDKGYVMCGGFAIKEMSINSTINEVISEIEILKNIAKKYENNYDI